MKIANVSRAKTTAAKPIMAIIAIATAFTLNACSSDDDKGGSSGGNSKWCRTASNPDYDLVMCAEIGKPLVVPDRGIVKEGDIFTEEMCRNLLNATPSENKPNNCNGFFTYSGGSGEWCVVNHPDDGGLCFEIGKKLTINDEVFFNKGEVFTREKCNMMVAEGDATIKTKPESCAIFTE